MRVVYGWLNPSDMGSEPRILLLGPVRVENDGIDAEIPPKARLLATRLAMSAPRAVSVDVLIEDLWAGDPPATARKSLQKYVWELRSHLGDAAIVTEGPGYQLAAGTDVAQLDLLVAGARAAMSDGRPADAAPLLTEALALFRGQPLQGLADVPFVAEEARRLNEISVSVEEDLAEVDIDLGKHIEAAERLDRLVTESPMRERLVASLMTALYRGGRHAEALVELEERILVHDQALVPAAAPVSHAPWLPERTAVSSVAVLPFTDLSPAQDQAYFGDGVAVEVIRMLSRLPGVRVASRGSSFAYRSSPLDVRRIASELGVTSVLEGSVQRQDDRVRITVGLTDALEGFQIWAETYDRTVSDMFVIQEEIAASVVQALSVRLDESSRRRTIGPGAEAHDMYLQGRHHFYRGGTEETKRAISLFQEATRIAPNYCLALAGLADACSFLHLYYEPHPETLAAAESYGRRAVDADASMAEPNASLGFALGAAGRYEEARESFGRALALPGGRFESAYLFGRTMFAQGDMEGAGKLFSTAVRIRPEDFHATALLAKVLRANGDDKGSMAMQRRVYDLVDYHLRLIPDDARALGDGAAALVALGRVGEGLAMADRALAITHSPMPYYAAGAIAQAGRGEVALDALEQVIVAGWSHHDFLEHDPDWAELRDRERFQAALSRLS
jgi:adenylate cyclase